MTKPTLKKKKKSTAHLFKKGHKAFGGRKKGAKNKFNKSLKDAFIKTFNDLGGSKGLTKWAKKNKSNRRIFYQMMSRMLPREVAMTGTDSKDVRSIKLEIVKGGNTKS